MMRATREIEKTIENMLNKYTIKVEERDGVYGLRVHPQPTEEDLETLRSIKGEMIDYLLKREEERRIAYAEWKERLKEHNEEIESIDSPIFDSVISMLENATYEEKRDFWKKIEHYRGLIFNGDDIRITIELGRGLWRPYLIVPDYGLCEYGSEASETFLAPNDYRRAFFERLRALLSTPEIQEYLLGEEGLEDYINTEEDRRLVDALSMGASMDMETGRIEGFDPDVESGFEGDWDE